MGDMGKFRMSFPSSLTPLPFFFPFFSKLLLSTHCIPRPGGAPSQWVTIAYHSKAQGTVGAQRRDSDPTEDGAQRALGTGKHVH